MALAVVFIVFLRKQTAMSTDLLLGAYGYPRMQWCQQINVHNCDLLILGHFDSSPIFF